ncbi:hypothetical protein [Corynebacterium aquilae]|uniref:hypothetical protein n=1 Tax=Corynebacterium aquilae TaxID=203263 RepID=UPI0012ED54DE|nr:hypothetical protein [Corynebacterium aquilae]
MSTFSAVTVCALAFGVGACGSATEESTQAAATATEDAGALNVDAPKLTLVDEGTGEKRVLEYDLTGKKDVVDSGHLYVAQGFSQQMLPAEGLNPLPPEQSDVIGLNADYEATSVSSPDASMVDIVLASSRFDDLSRAEQVQSAADGFDVKLSTLPTGQIRTVSLTAPQDSADEGRAAVESLVMALLATPVQFPTDPVGEGAVWELDSRVPGSNALLQKTTLTATKISDSGVDLEVSIQQRPTQGALDLGDVGLTGELKVQSSQTLSRGKLHVDFTKPVPTSGKVESITRIVYGRAGDEGADSTRVVQDMSTQVEYS